jgi:ZIP family zinc transporter
MTMEYLSGLSPVTLALLGGLFTWLMTAIGATVVLLRKDMSRMTLDVMLGFAAGVMIAASFWSLLAPAIAMSAGTGLPKWLPATVGFLAGGVFLRTLDYVLPHLHFESHAGEAEGIKTTWHRTTLLVLAITLHNIPEGLSVGVAFGGVGTGVGQASLAGAMALAFGIGLQDVPEGAAVSLPLRREGNSMFKSWVYGVLSGIVEPMAAVVGALFVMMSHALLPYALSFAAGAMIFVVSEEVIPESQANGNGDQATMGLMFGFALMMVMDVAFS